MTQTPFDPAKYLRRIRWQGQTIDYLDVKWRLVWLRADHPDAQIATEHVHITPDFAVFRAAVTIPGQGAATGYGSARAAEGVNHVEQAETAALGRALLALGYGTAYAPDFALPADEAPAGEVPGPPAQPAGLPPGVTIGPSGSRSLPPRLAAVFAQAQPIIDEPAAEAPATPLGSATGETPPAPAPPADLAPRPAEPAAPPAPLRPVAPPARPPRGLPAGAAAPAPPPARRAEPASRPAPPSFTIREGSHTLDRPRPTTTGGESPERAPAGRASRATPVFEDELDSGAEPADEPLADHDWSAFWRWARARGYVNRDEVERAIGQSIRGRTPREIRTLILNLDA